MEKANKYGIILDGCMDEPVWDAAKEYTGFRKFLLHGGEILEEKEQTFFKILSCEDRIYVGIRCNEPDMEFMEQVKTELNSWGSPAMELFFSPTGNPREFYQFFVAYGEQTDSLFYDEGGQIQPDPYAPRWKRAVYAGEDYWSCEVEIPLSAFYMTRNDCWSDTWLVNMGRTRWCRDGWVYSTWMPTENGFIEPERFGAVDGMPMRQLADDVLISSAFVDLTEQNQDGYRGTMTVQVKLAVGGTFTFTSPDTQSITLELPAGNSQIVTPCFFAKLGRPKVELSLKRESSGEVYGRKYPVLVQYEPIKLQFTLPEYRNNFYPGQDYTKITGKAFSQKPITLILEGAGIPTTTITPEPDGSFVFATPDFQVGEAWLTAKIDGYELKKKIRRLAPTGRMMAWVSGGNLILNGKPVLRRCFYGPHYRVGTVFDTKYDADNMHETREFDTYYHMGPDVLIPGSESAGGEATMDGMPSEAMLRAVDAVIEAHKDEDFTHYYISDEPDCRNLSEVYMKHLYEYIADKDPYHLILTATRSADRYVGIADWFETHPYLNPYNRPDGTRAYVRQINYLGKFVEDIVKLNRPDKCIGFLPTCFSEKYTTLIADYPNFDEIICHTWAAMMRGGKSLWPYAYHDVADRPALYEGFRYVFSTFEALEEIVLMAKRTTLCRTSEAECVLYEHGKEKMFVLVNMLANAQKITVEGLDGAWYAFRHDQKIRGYTFNLKPFEVVIGTTSVMDNGLPTCQQTKKLIDDMEYARTHRGNILFACEGKIKVETSQTNHIYNYKLFDGMLENQGVRIDTRKGGFYQMDLTAIERTMQKVMVHGYNLEGLRILTGKENALEEPAIKEISYGENCKIFSLAEPITPDILRLQFDVGEFTELYEIEAFA